MPRPRGSALRVKPGTIRLARTEAQLTLEQLARGLVSKQAVHQYEAGAASPSLPVLQAIAERTGKTLDFFLDEQPQSAAEVILEIESAFLQRDLERSVDLGKRALGLAMTAEERARVQAVMGGALMHLSRPNEALQPLRAARAYLRQNADPWALAEVMDWEACCLHQLESPGAVALAEEALVLCRSREPAPRELEARILGHLGSFAVRQRDWSRARATYEEALAVAEGLLDLRLLALMHHNLSIAYQRSGQPELARREADRALGLLSAQTSRADLARMQSDYGDLLYQQGHLAEAEEYLRRALATYSATEDQRNRPYTLITLTQVLIATERLGEAADVLKEAEALAADHADLGLVAASVQRTRGRLAAAFGDLNTARRLYLEAAGSFERLSHLPLAAETRAELATHLERAGDLEGAVRELRLANDIALGTWAPSAKHMTPIDDSEAAG